MVALEERRDSAGDALWENETGRAWHEQVLEDPAQEHLLGEIRRQAVGFAVLSGLGSPRIELRRLVLSPEWRGDGPARMFLREVVNRVHDRHSAQQLWLRTRTSDEQTRAFYASEGFVPSGDRPSLHLAPDGSAATLVVMTHQR